MGLASGTPDFLEELALTIIHDRGLVRQSGLPRPRHAKIAVCDSPRLFEFQDLKHVAPFV